MSDSLRSKAQVAVADLVLKVEPPIAFDACVRALQVLNGVASHFRSKGWPAELVTEAFLVGQAIGQLENALEEMGVRDVRRFVDALRPEEPR